MPDAVVCLGHVKTSPRLYVQLVGNDVHCVKINIKQWLWADDVFTVCDKM